MTLTHPIFRANQRIVDASRNAPPMTRGEQNAEAVRILQRALISVGAATMRRSMADGQPDGHYGTETFQGVKRFRLMTGLADTRGQAHGSADRSFWAEMDERAPRDLAPPINAAAESPTTTQAPIAPRLPTAEAMFREYRRFRDISWPGHPCLLRLGEDQHRITHQCGIRLSVALMRCDIGFHFNHARLHGLVHAGGESCGIDIPHCPYPERLMEHMQRFWHSEHWRTDPDRPRHTNWQDVAEHCEMRPGIILFMNLRPFRGRAVRRGGRGDHIDYWDGRWIMNDRLRYNADDERGFEDEGMRHRFFSHAREIKFIPLTY